MFIGWAPLYRTDGELLIDERPLRTGSSPNPTPPFRRGFLGVAAIHEVDGEYQADINSIYRVGIQPNIEGSIMYDDFAYDDDEFEGVYDDDYYGYDDDDDDEDEEFGVSRGRARRMKRRNKRSRRRIARNEKRINRRNRRMGIEERASDEASWQKTIVSGSKTEAAAGAVVATIQLQHHFKAESIFFNGSSADAEVTSIVFGDDLIWNNAEGVDVSALTTSSFVKDLVEGATGSPGTVISVSGTIANANDVLKFGISGVKPKRRLC